MTNNARGLIGVTILGLIAFTVPSSAQPVRQSLQLVSIPPAPAPVNALPVGRCVNIGNHLEAPSETAYGRAIADDDFTIIAEAGFTTVRIPVRWSGHAGLTSPYQIDPAFMARVQHVVGLARAAGLNVILNDHHFDALHTDPEGNRDRLAGIWRQVAAAFANQPRDHVWFEIANEPNGKLDNANLLATLSPSLAAIRATNPDRPVIIGGEFWSGISSLATLTLPDDPYVVPTFHYYEPFEFTHQGASWVGTPPPVGRRYGSVADQQRMTGDIGKVTAYIARTGKTPFVGETGAYEVIPLKQRLKYMTAMRQGWDSIGLGQCTWAFTNTFPIYNSARRQWVKGARKALGLPE
jgi:endoglucanase